MRSFFGLAAAAVTVAIAAAPAAIADPIFTPLYWFRDTIAWQGIATSNPVIGPDNALYLTTYSADGPVLQFTPPTGGGKFWTPKILYQFGVGDANVPYSLIRTPSGALIGTTLPTEGNSGEVYELTPPAAGKTVWSFSSIWQFADTPAANEGPPGFGVVMDGKGRLFGVTDLGGAQGDGTVFMLTPPAKAGAAWTKTILHAFSGVDGMNPQGSLVVDKDGTLYGTTKIGGIHHDGTIFMLSPPATGTGAWTFKKLFDFTGGADNGFPTRQLAFDPAHKMLYGVANPVFTGQTGVVFSIAKPTGSGGKWVFSIVHAFQDNFVDGTADTEEGSLSSPVVDTAGNIYGTAPAGGDKQSIGVVYKLTPPQSAGGAWTETILHQFKGTDGFVPNYLSIASDGTLYGVTINDGAYGSTIGVGGLFSLKP
jgi:hypothetical protein